MTGLAGALFAQDRFADARDVYVSRTYAYIAADAGMVVVDLGAAPGGWSQIARPLLGSKGRLIALDILPMEPLKDVEFILGDFREEAVLHQLETAVGEQAVDLVLSDMAPNISGIGAADQASSLYLCELALDFCAAHLKKAGVLVVKVFQGEGFDAY